MPNTPSGSSTALHSSLTPTSFALPPRPKGDGQARAAVWSLAPEEVDAPGADSDNTSLASKCDVHEQSRTVCCRELKGDDERSLINPDIVRDIIIGLADGLTVPFALTAGLSSLGSSRLVYVAGVAELVSGALSMGVGGYLSAQAERDHYRYLKRTTRERVMRSCAGEMERECHAILSPLGIDESISRRVAGALLKVEATLPDPKTPPSIFRQCLTTLARKPKFSGADEEHRIRLLDDDEEGEDRGLTSFLLKFGEGLEEVSDSRLFISAFTIGTAYFLGGLVPLCPYFIVETAFEGLLWSIAITTVMLLLFGAFKTFYTGAEVGFRGYTYGCLSTLAVGGAAAAASFAIVKALEGSGL